MNNKEELPEHFLRRVISVGDLLSLAVSLLALHKVLSATFTNSGAKAIEACTLTYRLA